MKTVPPLTDEELRLLGAYGRDVSRDELKEYHAELIKRYGHIPKWAGPFHWCRKCLWPKLCEDHKYD